MTIKPLATVAAVCFLAWPLGAPRAQGEQAQVVKPPTDPLLEILSAELQRELEALKGQELPPYFVSYAVGDVDTTWLSASFGALTGRHQQQERLLTVDVRVGDYQLDSSHKIRGAWDFDRSGPSSLRIARDDTPEAIQVAVWNATNEAYRRAVKQLPKAKANVAVKVAAEDASPDFSKEAPVQSAEPPPKAALTAADLDGWAARLKAHSAVFLQDPHILVGDASLVVTAERKHLVTSEGTRLVQNLSYAQLRFQGVIKADDGMELPLYRQYFAFKPSDLPSEGAVAADLKALVGKLVALRSAPVVEPFTGPAILDGRAAGVFFHEVFGHRVEGHRQKDEDDGRTFAKKVGEAILPAHLSVTFDPTLSEYAGFQLVGRYAYDDEGVKAQRVAVVDKGVLKGFLMSRSPIAGFPHSNGHGRAQAGRAPVSRQSNLLVTSSAPVKPDVLRQRLIAECRKQGRPYGLRFADIQGGFTFTGRSIPNSFNVMPVEVYRVYVDGRPDELVRGVDLVGTPLVMLSKIADADDRYSAFNGVCGAESGGVPVSAVAPDLLVSQVEVQKKSKSQERPHLLPRPDADQAPAGRTP